VIAAAVAAGLLLLAALSMRSGTGLVASTVASMPTGVAKVLQRGLDAIAGAVFGSGRDGFRWIVVDDPRTRKADRLPEAAPRR
jgi:hypothetical protein